MNRENCGNCYAYSLRISMTDSDDVATLPGILLVENNKVDYNKYIAENNNITLDGDIENFVKKLVINIQKDSIRLGFKFDSCSTDVNTKENSWIVALAIRRSQFPVTKKYYFDFHWYRKEIDGTWTHKQGDVGYPSSLDSSGNVIHDPACADRGLYNNFVGYYRITWITKEA